MARTKITFRRSSCARRVPGVNLVNVHRPVCHFFVSCFTILTLLHRLFLSLLLRIRLKGGCIAVDVFDGSKKSNVYKAR